MEAHPRGPQAARLRQRKFQLIRRFHLPDNLLPGSLSLTHRRCGKPTCHCACGEGHPIGYLGFMANGKHRVEPMPVDWVDAVRQQVEAGREFQDAVREVLTANAELLVLWRKQRKKKRDK